MSAPRIPNLNTLRRGGLRGRGRGSGTQDGWTPDRPRRNQDDIIRNTDNDAATSRLSAVDAGYLEDPFAKLLSTSDEHPRRLPLMNRGTYVRTTAIDRIVDTFIASHPNSQIQIISLGAGTDTRFFRLRQQHPTVDLLYHELDFEAITGSKILRLRSPSFVSKVKQLCQLDLLAPEFEVLEAGTRLRSPTYCIHPVDLRTLSHARTFLPDIDAGLPTLLVSECCLIYLSPDHAEAVLVHFTQLFSSIVPLAIVIYEPIRPNDSFGRTMVSNLTARGIVLQTLEKFADLKEQERRLREHGFRQSNEDSEGSCGAEAADIEFIWRTWVDEKEKQRVESLEWMDEVEEFVLLARHYCVAWGWRGFEQSTAWSNLAAPEPG